MGVRRHLVLAALAALAVACGQRLPGRGEGPAPAGGAEAPATVVAPAVPPATVVAPAVPPAPGTVPGAGAEVPAAAADRLTPYRGLGAWVDLFDRALWAAPEATVEDLVARGVRTLFLETGSYRFPGPILRPEAAGRFLEAAHARGMRVVAWYVPDFARLRRDLGWSLATVGFRSPGGHAFDSFALDIEVTKVADPVRRAERLLRLSEELRGFVGPAYPLGAIVPSPLRGPGYWPVLPLDRLASLYDVVLPMAYWTYHADGEAGAYDYIARSVEITRAQAGRADVPIHMIGGIAHPAGPDEIRGFARAVSDAGLMGASIYDVATTGEDDWAILRRLGS